MKAAVNVKAALAAGKQRKGESERERGSWRRDETTGKTFTMRTTPPRLYNMCARGGEGRAREEGSLEPWASQI